MCAGLRWDQNIRLWDGKGQKITESERTTMKIRTTLSVLVAGLLSGGLLCQQLQALPITGNITFKGGVNLDSGDVGTADAVSAWISPTVESRDGTFASFISAGAAVTMTAPWVFDPSVPLPALWSVGGFTFDLTSSTILFQNSLGLIVAGAGTVSGNGFDATPGTFNFSTQSPSAEGDFSFSTGAATIAPDGGLTVTLLGLALIGLQGFRRKLAK